MEGKRNRKERRRKKGKRQREDRDGERENKNYPFRKEKIGEREREYRLEEAGYLLPSAEGAGLREGRTCLLKEQGTLVTGQASRS